MSCVLANCLDLYMGDKYLEVNMVNAITIAC